MNQLIYYSNKDFEFIEKYIEDNKLIKRIYITGDMGSGKSHFSRKFATLGTHKFIELDKERRIYNGKTRSEVLQMTIEKNKGCAYILEHYRLLDNNYIIDKANPNTLSVWKDSGDILILLHPPRQSVVYAFSDQKTLFDKLDGDLIYSNVVTGTYVKQLQKLDRQNAV